jgi:hypothetical protein
LNLRTCELCELAPLTRRHAEFDVPFRFVIVDCDSCDVPMAVLGEHRARPTGEEKAVMQRALAQVADALLPRGWFFDDHMRQIPDHYHLHARRRWWKWG